MEKEYELVSFEDDGYELKGRIITGFRYRNERHAISTWKEMLVQVCKLMYNENLSTMVYLATKDSYLHEADSEDRSKVAENCYIYIAPVALTRRERYFRICYITSLKDLKMFGYFYEVPFIGFFRVLSFL